MTDKNQLVIQTEGPFKVFCHTCERWVDGDRVNIDGTHDADESKPVRTGRGVPPPERTTHNVWEPKPHPADAYSYAPCIKGTIEIGETTSEFMLPIFNDSVRYSQWGADTQVLGGRVDLVEKLADAAAEWADENLCRSCGENLLNDGEGYNGECGDCADKTEAALHTPGTRVLWTDPKSGKRMLGVVVSGEPGSDEITVRSDDGVTAELTCDDLEKETD